MKPEMKSFYTDVAIMLLSVVLGIMICSAWQADHRANHSTFVKARVQPAIWDASKDAYVPYSNEVEVKEIDSAYCPGDALTIDGQEYIVMAERKASTDYSIEIISKDWLAVWDAARLVGYLPLTDKSDLGRLIYKDNE